MCKNIIDLYKNMWIRIELFSSLIQYFFYLDCKMYSTECVQLLLVCLLYTLSFTGKKDVARSMTKVGKSDERPLHTFFVWIFVQNLKFP